MTRKLKEIGTAHQKIVRDRMAISDGDGLFGRYWEGLNLSLRDCVIKELDLASASKMIVKYEWLGCMPAVNFFAFGIFFDGVCGGCVVFGQEYTENLGVWDKYDFTNKIILLSRGVCLHWAPKNANSKLIMAAIKLLPEKYKIVTATTDSLAGEVGTIYQACNFKYVGSMREASGLTIDREGWLIDGKLYGSRAIRQKIGSQKHSEILAMFPTAEKIKQVSKSRYFYFRGSKREIKYYESKINHLIKPYPKRTS